MSCLYSIDHSNCACTYRIGIPLDLYLCVINSEAIQTLSTTTLPYQGDHEIFCLVTFCCRGKKTVDVCVKSILFHSTVLLNVFRSDGQPISRQSIATFLRRLEERVSAGSDVIMSNNKEKRQLTVNCFLKNEINATVLYCTALRSSRLKIR